MVIDISEIIGKNGSSIEFFVSDNLEKPTNISSVTAFKNPITVKGVALNLGNSIQVKGSCETTLIINCDRCLKPCDVELSFDFEEDFTSNGNDNENTEKYSGSSIDLYSVIEKNISLNLPMKVICKEDCKGLCQSCGCNLNLEACSCSSEEFDPRFEVLRSLFKVDKEV